MWFDFVVMLCVCEYVIEQLGSDDRRCGQLKPESALSGSIHFLR